MAEMPLPQVFISYAREDIAHARQLCAALQRAGADPWLDEHRLLPGQDWKAAIANAISGSRYFIALLSSHSVSKRGFVQSEMKQALAVLDELPASQVFLIPARLHDVQSTYPALRNLHLVDLFPDWEQGVAKILLTMDLHTGARYVPRGSNTVAQPRDKSFRMSANWAADGLEIVGGRLRIPPAESGPLFRSWLQWVPHFVTQEGPKSTSQDEALERAFILATLRACADVYKAVPDEEEMLRGSSILSRKLNLFYSFARDAYLKARQKGIDLHEYLFPEEDAASRGAAMAPDDGRTLLRTMLRQYVSRVCDVRHEEVERFESVMRDFPPWEGLVERAYEIDEEAVLTGFETLKQRMPDASDEDLVDGMIAAFVDAQLGLDHIPLDSNESA